MCGISGFFFLNKFSIHGESLQTLRNMTSVLKHRGSDASGYWSSERDNIFKIILLTSPSLRKIIYSRITKVT